MGLTLARLSRVSELNNGAPSAEAMTAPRAREQRRPPSPPDRRPPRRGGDSSPATYAASAAGRAAGPARLAPRGLVRCARALAAAALLALTGALFLPPTAEAQTGTTLVSNIAQSTYTNGGRRHVSQPFDTGSNEDGYTLTGVDVASASSTGFTAQVCGVDSTNRPTSACWDLMPPGTFAVGTMSFTAPTNTVLGKSTTYTVVVRARETNTQRPGETWEGVPTNGYAQGWGFQTSSFANDEDPGSAAGWSIGDTGHYVSAGNTLGINTWIPHFRDLRIAIKGSAAGGGTPTNNPPVFTSSASLSVEENTLTATVVAVDNDTDDDITGYAITGGTDQDFFSEVTSAGVLSFDEAPNFEDPEDSGTDNTYVVTVQATSGTGTREMTATQTITVTVTDADEKSAKPDKPTLAKVTGSSTTLTATWTKPGLNGGPDITGYDVQYKLSTETSWTAFAHTGAALTTTITGLTADTSYQVQVRAKNGETDSDWSDASDAVSTNAEMSTPLSTDATLSALSVTARLPLMTFVSGTTSYATSVKHDVDEVKVAATTNDSNATFEIQDASDMTLTDADISANGFQVELAASATVIKVKVTAEDRTTTQTYTVTVTRAVITPVTPPADALVSNVSQSSNSNSYFDKATAQGFTTGSNASGYTLTGVDVLSASTTGFTAQVCGTDSSGLPTSTCTALTAPGSIAVGKNAFTAPANTTLVKDTTYAVVVTADGATQGWGVTGADGEDAGKADGWSIADTRPTRKAGSTWGPSSKTTALRVAVRGSAVGGTANNAPVFSPTTATREVAENSTAGTNVGAAIPEATDADSGDTLTYSMEGTDAASFAFDASNRQITTITGVTYNFEATKNSYSVTVKASDGTASATIAVTIDVTDVNEKSAKPDKPTLAKVTGSSNTLVASWTKPGLNGGPEITGYDVQYKVSTDSSWTAFAHTGEAVATTITGLTADTSYQVRVRANNGEVLSDWSDPSDAVKTNAAAAAPTISAVAVTSTPVLETDTYGAGERIEVTVTFSEAVNATSDTDFVLSVAGAKRAPLVRGSGTATLVFGYTVVPGDEDDNGIWIGDQDRTLVGDRMGLPQNGTITSVATSTAADLTHAELGQQSGHKVDGSRSIVSVAVSSTPMLQTDTYGAGETIRFTVTFNVAVDVSGDPVLTFALGNQGQVRDVDAAHEGGTGSTALVFAYTVVSTDEDNNGIFLRDEDDFNNPDGPVRLDSDDTIRFAGTSTDVPLYWQGRGTQSGHKVDGSRTTGNTAPSFTSSATFDAAENQTAVGTVVAADSDADDNITGYAITGGADQALFEIGATTGELTFDNAPNFEDPEDSGTDNTYVVTVEATSGMGTREMTATQTITVTVTDADEKSAKPDKPTLAKVTGSSTSLTATWTKPDLDGGPEITGYAVQYKVNTATTWEDFAHSGTAVTTTVTGLTADTSYQVQVRAKNGETDSDWSDASDAVKTNAEMSTPSCTLNTGDLWCGVVTVALHTVGGFDLAYGFVDASATTNTSDTGALSDETFSVGTNNYTIDGVTVGIDTNNGQLNFSLTSDLTAADKEKLVVHVGSRAFAFDDVAPNISSGYKWALSGLDWSSETSVTLRLRANTAPVFADDLVAITLPENSAVGTSVGAVVTATDADDDTLTYSLEGTDAASFDIDSGTGQIKTKSGVTYDFEATQNTYEMTVKADDGNGGTDTIEVNIALLDADEKPDKPDKPVLARVTGSSTSLTATWVKPDLNGGPDITGYKLEYKLSTETSWTEFAHTGTAVTATVTGLTADTAYQARVLAENGETDSDWSDPSDAVKTNAAGAACTDNDIDLVRGMDNTEGSVQICHSNEWRSVCDDSFDQDTDAEVANGWAFAGVVCRQRGHATGAATESSHFGQVFPVSYWLDEVVCTGSEANLGACTHADWGVSDCRFPERAGVKCTVAATGLAATGGDGEVDLAWDAPGADPGITRHEYRNRKTGGAYPAAWTPVPDSAADETNEASYTVTGLAAGTEYDFELRIVGGANASDADEATARTTGVAAPTNFTATAGDAQVMLSWDAPETGSGVTKHQYRQKTTGSYPATWTDIPNSEEDGANEAGFTVTTNIVNDTAYTFELRAVKDTTNSDAVEDGPVTPMAVTPGTCTLNTGDLWCGVVTVEELVFEGTSFAYGFVDASASPNPSDTGALSNKNFTVTLGTIPYTIDVATVGLGATAEGLNFSLTSALTAADLAKLVLHVDGGSGTFAFSDATRTNDGFTYQWSMTGLDWTSETSVTLRLRLAPEAPGKPTNLMAEADGGTRIALSWDAPADDGGSAITGYRIEVSDDAGSNWEDLVDDTGNDDTTYTHEGLSPGDTRHYRVSAINAEGASVASDVADATTAAATTCTLNPGDLWCGVVTVGTSTGGGNIHLGFSEAQGFGSLSEKEFTVGTNRYTIDFISEGVGINNGTLTFSLSSNLAAADRAVLVLHVDGSNDPLAFSDASGPTSFGQWLLLGWHQRRLVRRGHRHAAAAGGSRDRCEPERADRDPLRRRDRAAAPGVCAGHRGVPGMGGEPGGRGDGGGDGERRRRGGRVSRRRRGGDRRRGHQHARPGGGPGGWRHRRRGEGDGRGRHHHADLPGDGDAGRRGRPGHRGRVPPGARDRGGLRGPGQRPPRRDGACRGVPRRGVGHGVQGRHQVQQLQHLRPRRER